MRGGFAGGLEPRVLEDLLEGGPVLCMEFQEPLDQ